MLGPSDLPVSTRALPSERRQRLQVDEVGTTMQCPLRLWQTGRQMMKAIPLTFRLLTRETEKHLSRVGPSQIHPLGQTSTGLLW